MVAIKGEVAALGIKIHTWCYARKEGCFMQYLQLEAIQVEHLL